MDKSRNGYILFRKYSMIYEIFSSALCQKYLECLWSLPAEKEESSF